jgi:hypothetical protein
MIRVVGIGISFKFTYPSDSMRYKKVQEILGFLSSTDMKVLQDIPKELRDPTPWYDIHCG